MAARLNRMHTESIVQKIKGDHLLTRLQDHVLGDVEMSKTQVDATKWLLERILARAEAPRTHNVNLTLSDLIQRSLGIANDAAE